MEGIATLKCTLSLPATFTREGDWIVGCFPHLDVTSQGRDQEEATRNLIEAAQTFIESCFERNVLNEVLKNCGFAAGGPQTERELPHDTRQHLTVPFELLSARHAATANY